MHWVPHNAAWRRPVRCPTSVLSKGSGNERTAQSSSARTPAPLGHVLNLEKKKIGYGRESERCCVLHAKPSALRIKNRPLSASG